MSQGGSILQLVSTTNFKSWLLSVTGSTHCKMSSSTGSAVTVISVFHPVLKVLQSPTDHLHSILSFVISWLFKSAKSPVDDGLGLLAFNMLVDGRSDSSHSGCCPDVAVSAVSGHAVKQHLKQ